MAHSCPNCDSLCHCGGDIDDHQLDGTMEQHECTCCTDELDPDDELFDPRDYE